MVTLEQIKGMLISTHALTWRATSLVRYKSRRQRYFYPRPHMEGDQGLMDAGKAWQDFYPRPHMEGDMHGRALEILQIYFYPRPHMEGDLETQRSWQ